MREGEEDDQLLEEVDHVEEVEPEIPEEVVDPNAPPPAAVVIDPAEFKRVQKDLAASRRAQRESDETARYWAEQARTGGRQAAREVVKEPEDDFNDVDLVETITASGVAGLDGVLKRLGYAKTSDVDSKVAGATNRITSETALMNAYPELADDKSALFQATAKIFNQLRSDPAMADSPNLIQYAARTAKAEMALRADGGRGLRRAASPDEDPDSDEQESVEDRAARVGRQTGDRGRRDARGAATSGDTLSDLQRSMVQKFQQAGAPLTEDQYRRHAKAGVRMGGMPVRGRAA